MTQAPPSAVSAAREEGDEGDSRDDLPLYRRFPALRAIPRARICTLPTPVERLAGMGTLGERLWIKRDDLSAPPCGGNKARTLEFLLGSVAAGDTVLTLGGAGSAHVLATAIHARALGARTHALRWRHHMNPTATRVSERLVQLCASAPVLHSSLSALLRGQLARVRGGVYYVPAGGSSALGALAHVNAALELAEQLRAGLMPIPAHVVLPLGSGGTTAGLALGLAIAGLDITVVGVQVAPRIVANSWRVRRLAGAAARLIEHMTGERVPRIDPGRLRIVRTEYGGAYGRPTARATAIAPMLEQVCGIRLDQSYTAKAFVAALDIAQRDRRPTLFWNTFDARVL